MKKLLILTLMFWTALGLNAQSVKGMVVDNNNEPLIGASVFVAKTTNGTITDVDGSFMLNDVPVGSRIEVSYVGYQTTRFTVEGMDMGTLMVKQSAIGLESVVITGTMDIVKDRRTPVAVSTIGIREIQAKAGNVEFPELMKNTPSIYVANQAGGFGDSEVFTRGFDQTNTAFLLNGQPINGMEDGRMYWSNWSGMTDVATAVQVQRGLGSSKLAISSVGGTINIIMKPTEQEQGGSVSYLRGNDNYNKATVMYNSGMGENNFGYSILLTHWQGDGWADGTKGQGQNYFISMGWNASERSQFNFLLTGAPQWHDQNFGKSINDHYQNGEFDIKFNNNWGTLDGEYFTERRNYYHKPVANLNWDYQINDKTSLSSVLYASWGRGGGTGGLGNFGNRPRTEDGQIDFDATVANNMADPDGDVYVRRASVNNHQWFGLVSTLDNQISSKVNLSIGADLRRYTGSHFRQVTDLLGANGYSQSGRTRFPDGYVVTETFDPNPWQAISNFAAEAPAGERVAYNNDETIQYQGLFAQAEYADDKVSLFFQGAVSNQSSTRFELFNELEENKESETVNEIGYNVKTGFSYAFDNKNLFFANTGYYKRQPFFDNQFLNFSNTVNPVTSPEDIFGIEAGYKYTGKNFAANVNVYRTSWKGRVTTSTIDIGEEVDGFLFPEGGFVNTAGLNQLHTGVELDLRYRMNDDLTIKAYSSIGNWQYDGIVQRDLFEDNLDRTLVASFDDENIDGVKVGGAAQTSIGLGIDYRITSALRLDLDYNYYDNLYSNLGASIDELKLPSFGIADLGLSYSINMSNGDIVSLRANVFNLLGEEYISRATTSIEASDVEDENWNGINRGNRVTFGQTRTWNASVRYNF